MRILLIYLCFFTFIGCSSSQPKQQTKTQLEIRQFQTRIFEAVDIKKVMKSVLNVLQDEGFIVKNVALDLGFLTAAKEEDIEKRSDKFWAAVANMNNSSGAQTGWQKQKIVDATVNVTEYGDKIRIRANFQLKKIDNLGRVINITQIQDETFYRDFFSKVDKGLFLEKEDL